MTATDYATAVDPLDVNCGASLSFGQIRISFMVIKSQSRAVMWMFAFIRLSTYQAIYSDYLVDILVRTLICLVLVVTAFRAIFEVYREKICG